MRYECGPISLPTRTRTHGHFPRSRDSAANTVQQSTRCRARPDILNGAAATPDPAGPNKGCTQQQQQRTTSSVLCARTGGLTQGCLCPIHRTLHRECSSSFMFFLCSPFAALCFELSVPLPLGCAGRMCSDGKRGLQNLFAVCVCCMS